MKLLETIPTPREIRAAVPDEARKPSWLRALAVLAPSLIFYLACWFACAVLPWWTWPIWSPLIGIALAILFVLGHDGAHHSFVSNRTVNAWVARLTFAPSWHGYTGWVNSHNYVHHCWTNYAPKDFGWRPYSLEEYRALSPWGQALYRFGRSWPGFAYYYGKSILWDHVILIPKEVRNRKMRITWILDDLFILVFFAFHVWATLAVAARFGNDAHPIGLIIAALIVPAIVSTWLNAFITYMQHTHAKVAWFACPKEWNFFYGQVMGTTHTELPIGLGSVFHHINEHAAHHVDPHIPLYHLPDAQKQLIAAFPSVRNFFTFRSFRHNQRVCRLYDYQRHCWLDYNGEQTSSRTIEEEALELARSSRGAARESHEALAN